MLNSRLRMMPATAAPATQGMPFVKPGNGMLPPKAYCPPRPMIIMHAMTAMFFEENMSHFLSIMIAIPCAAIAPNR